MLIAATLLLAAAQEAPASAPQDAGAPQRWSILVDPCAGARTPDEIVVCGQGASPAPRLPLPAERGPPDHPAPSNPDLSGMGALAAASPPCATRSEGCTTGVDLIGGGTFLIRAVEKLVDSESCCDSPGEATNPIALADEIGGVFKRTFKKKPDKANRVPISLDDVPDPGLAPQGDYAIELPLP